MRFLWASWTFSLNVVSAKVSTAARTRPSRDKSSGRFGSAWSALSHSSGRTHNEIDKACGYSKSLVKEQAKVVKSLKSIPDHDPWELVQQQQQQAIMRREGYYLAKLEKVAKARVENKEKRCQPPTITHLAWGDRVVEDEPSRIDLGDILAEAQRDPNKVIAWAGGDPGVCVTLESVPQSTNELLQHLNRFKALEGLPDSQVLNTKLLEKERPRFDDEGDVVGRNIHDQPGLTNDTAMETEQPSLLEIPMDMELNMTQDQQHQEAPPPSELRTLRLPPSIRTKAEHLQQVSFTKRLMDIRSRRFKRKKKKKRPRSHHGTIRKRGASTATPTAEHMIERARAAEDDLERLAEEAEEARRHQSRISTPSNSLRTAWNIADVKRIYNVRHEAHGPLRVLESKRRLSNLRRTQEHRKARAKAREVAQLKRSTQAHSTEPPQGTSAVVDPHTGFCRKCRHYHPPRHDAPSSLAYPEACPETGPDVLTVVAYGAAGSGVGSRIGGHLRWGGGWIREQLLRQGVLVLLTDEYCTCRTCVFCTQRLEQSKSRRLVGVEQKLKPIHGSVRCVNPLCTSVKAGYATRGRDSNAGIGILLSAASTSIKVISASRENQ